MTTPKQNEAVAFASASQLEALDKCRGDEHNGTVEVWMRATDTHDQPLYSQQTIDSLQGEVSRLRAVADAARVYFDGYCQDEASDEIDGNGRGRWTGCPAYQIRDALALKEALNLEPPTDGR